MAHESSQSLFRVNWYRGNYNSDWHFFDHVNLRLIDEDGVYVIKTRESPGRAVYVGQGEISERLIEHSKNSEITRHGMLSIAWAELHWSKIDGVERYIYEVYKPIEGKKWPDVNPIPVNLPDEL